MTTARVVPEPKALREVRTAPPLHWVGDGFPVRSMFSYNDDPRTISPFLLLDYAAPSPVPPSDEPRGVGEHPHRGFETVTIVYQGEVEHRDSAGHQGHIGPGDVQWMTAARGVVHEEKHGREWSRKGGTMEMVQLWVNLPARLKMSPPRYQDLTSAQIPVVTLPEGAGQARVIAGEALGARGPANTFTPVHLWDVRLSAGGRTALEVPAGFNTLMLVLSGRVQVGAGETVDAGELAVFAREGQTVTLEAPGEATVLVMSGEPIDEPVVGYGPFVMNSPEEIQQALRDYQVGKMGTLES